MAVKLEVTKEEHEALPEGVKEHYAEKDGKFFLQYEGQDKLKSALQSEREQREAEEKARKAAEVEAKRTKELLLGYEGIDPEEHKTLKKKAEEWASYDPEKKLTEAKTQWEKEKQSEYEAKMAKLQKDIEDEKAKLTESMKQKDETITTQNARLNKLLVDDAAQKAYLAAGGIQGSSALVLKAARDDIKLMQDDTGNMVPRIVGPDGKPRMTNVPHSADYMSLDEYFEEMKTSQPNLFNGSGKGGSGASASDSATTGKKTISRSDTRAMSANLEGIALGEVDVVD
jgi:hypothetical protein